MIIKLPDELATVSRYVALMPPLTTSDLLDGIIEKVRVIRTRPSYGEMTVAIKKVPARKASLKVLDLNGSPFRGQTRRAGNSEPDLLARGALILRMSALKAFRPYTVPVEAYCNRRAVIIQEFLFRGEENTLSRLEKTEDNLLFLKDLWNNLGMFQAGIVLNMGPTPELVRKTVKPNKTKDDPFWITFRENLAARLEASDIAQNRLELMIGAYRGDLSRLTRGSRFILPGDEQLVRLAKVLKFLPSELHSDFSRLDQRVMEEIRDERSPKDWLPVQILTGETKETADPAEPLCEKLGPQDGPHTERRPVMKKTMNEPEAQVDETLPVYARNIQALAARTGLSQAELARRANMSRDAFHRYVTGKTRPPVEKVYVLADLFRVDPTDIDPDRRYLRQKGALFTPQSLEPYKISGASNGDPDLVHLTLGMDVRHDTLARILELVADERRWRAERDAEERAEA